MDYESRLHEVGLSEFSVISDVVRERGTYKCSIQCNLCGNIEYNVDIHSKIRYKTHCKCSRKRVCIYCGKEYISESHTRSMCYECNPFKGNTKEFTQRIRQLNYDKYLKDTKQESCSICGYDKHKSVLEFHHIDPNTKVCNPASISHSKYSKFKLEADKCIVVCANCHRLIHNNIIDIRGNLI